MTYNHLLSFCSGQTEEKKLAMAGALVDPVDSGLLIFRNCTTEEVERIARDDPYTTGGLVTGWYDVSHVCSGTVANSGRQRYCPVSLLPIFSPNPAGLFASMPRCKEMQNNA